MKIKKLKKVIKKFNKKSTTKGSDFKPNWIDFNKIQIFGVRYFNENYETYDKKTSKFLLDNIDEIRNIKIIKMLENENIIKDIGRNDGTYEILFFEIDNLEHFKKYYIIYAIIIGFLGVFIPLLIHYL